ncbi:hypothetical protein VB796_18700 [Arcicella sp. LKC2W]|uniref:hypothetical protein n=1 Tax=Arcicella sp. LKC2W TaxID=2984198 RepID=UPI002B220C98|nr:hypothetical protein [Arcicella sp. LKC2W]MEA5461099.1 hypothetical protein [Arcicella sp. LKC2W]
MKSKNINLSNKNLNVELKDNLLLVLINRPEKRNAVNDELILGIEKNQISILMKLNVSLFMEKESILVQDLTSQN